MASPRRRYRAEVTVDVPPSSTSGRAARSDAAVIAFLAFVGVLMAYGIDAALPAFDELRDDFDLDERGLSPAITGTPYFVGAAVGQLVYGVFADRFGRRPTMLVGFVIYIVGAGAAAAAPSLGVLLVARLVWGLGAAAPTVLRLAIARDLYEGDQMARVVSTVSAVFLLGPIFVPVIGETILQFGSWRTVFAIGVPLAIVSILWTWGFGETLDPSHRRPLRLGPIADGVRAVATTGVTRWVMLAQVFATAAFFIWLGSAQPVIDVVYDRDEQFTLFFGASGTGMALALLVNNRLIRRFGVRRMVRLASFGFVTVTSAGLVAALATDGVPPLGVWFGWALAANACSMVMGPMSASLALEPMAEQAGTASSVLGVAQFGLGALLAAVVDAQVDATVTPMIVGALLYGTLALVALLAGLRAAQPSSEAMNVATASSA